MPSRSVPEKCTRDDLLDDGRAYIQVVDVFMALLVLVAVLSLAPVMYEFIGLIGAESDPLTAMFLQLVPPFILVGLIVSAGVSART